MRFSFRLFLRWHPPCNMLAMTEGMTSTARARCSFFRTHAYGCSIWHPDQGRLGLEKARKIGWFHCHTIAPIDHPIGTEP